MSYINKYDAGAKYGSASVCSDYFNWLCDIVTCGMEDGASYSILCSCLHSFKFYSTVEMDENRVKDAEDLHSLYCFANPALSEEWVMQCLGESVTVFEVMVSLARHMADFARPAMGIDEISYQYSIGKFFWEMVENLGLKDLTDEVFYEKNGGEIVTETVEKLLERNYSRKGKGGLFPVTRGSKDQRYMELWDQMHQYLNEKYPIL